MDENFLGGLLEDISVEMGYLASLKSIGLANIHESVHHLTEKYGEKNKDYFKQVFYAVLSIELNDKGRKSSV